ncbi:4-carboxy-4-hydroxy-2-oxoadipate aldolase/oxaloacetate decarboxylase [Bradyrhizobium jicamae]|uniref:4-carboxy-4-hydroxy-2-oxoadipate aldolase/oxaloacetate decarboxylase n=1 Tax=Bradyrhizobium jicamae TaxID=280332 RepID=UPI001BACEFB2|nr:4-carboxy-4-hydroxy-2-oxoadipate aldolase/oxaloacetate decarboxylase [Bradyrhizobium jicamae]
MIVVTNTSCAHPHVVAALGAIGVATVHEAQGRRGLMASHMRPVWRGARLAGSALTCEVAHGDNWMLHVAVEQARPGDVLVIAPTSPCDDGYIGDLLATALASRGVKGVVIDAGVRDVARLTDMAFPVWSKAVSAQGTVKETLANVQMPLVCAGVRVSPGEVVVADDDGVRIIASTDAAGVPARARAQEEKGEALLLRYATGELSLDVNKMRERLKDKGLR